MKLERSKVEFPLWRKKVDKSLFEYRGTQVIVTRRPEVANGCIFISEMTSYSGWGGFFLQDAGRIDAMNRIKNETARVGGDTFVLLGRSVLRI